MTQYRSDIDGLRAVAVIPIVLFHAGYEWISGGFIGVDIFFVISGYLISSILLNEMQQGDFSFFRFYERRVRRILPALLAMLLLTLVGGYFFLLPNEFIDLAQSILATAAFIPNIYFWDTSSTYFGLDIATTPLLHTWSLGVEEQFYIMFPLILYLLTSRCSRKTIISVLVALLLISLTANIVAVGASSKFAFYMLPTRAWELLIGVVLSLKILPVVKKGYVANLISLVGAGMIVFPMVTLNDSSVFPGMNAIPPVLGVAFIIYSSEHKFTVISRILSHKGLVVIGLISYSLYLWHWPVTVYTNMYWESDLNKPFIIILSLVLACLSYCFIETRFRKRSGVPVIRGKLKEMGAVAVLVLMASTVVLMNEGIPGRVPKEAWEIASTNDKLSEKRPCEQFSENPELDAEICVLGSNTVSPSFVLWGDSHAKAISYALHLSASELGLSGVLVSSHGCRPLLGVFRKGKYRCQTFNNEVEKYIKTHSSLEHIFLAGYWRIPFMGQGYDNSNFLIMDDQTILRSSDENRRVFRRSMEKTLIALKDFNTVVIQDIPEIGSQFGKSVARHFVRRAWLGNTSSDELLFKTRMDSFDQEFNEMMASMTHHQQFLEVSPLLCFDSKCPLLSNGKLIYEDGDHLSEYGASQLVPVFLRHFETRATASIQTIPLS